VVTLLSALIGTLAAWFVERTDVPCRRLLAILVVIPLGIPDFVVSFGWKAIFPSIAGFWAAVLVMTLAVYPLVFLPVAASLRAADPAQEEVARSLGLGRVRTFWIVTVGQARLAIFGGAILVGLVVLAEFGAFEILGYQTLTTEIYNEFQVGFNQPAACALSLILVLLGAMLLASEDTVRGRGRTSRLGAGAARELRPLPLGRLRPVVFGGLGLLVALALGVPVGAIAYLLLQGGTSTLPAAASLPDATLNTFGYAAAAGVLSTLAAVPIALLSVRFPRRKVLSLERSNLVVLAVPGLVIALSLTYVTEHFLQGRFYQSSPLLVVAYAIMFFPLAVVSVRAAVARAPVGFEEVAGSLGVSKRSVLWRVTLPLMGPGLVAAFALVFLESASFIPPTWRRSPPSSGPTSRTCRTTKPPLMRPSWCSLPPCRAMCSVAGSTASRLGWEPRARAPSTSQAHACRPEWLRREGPSHHRRGQGVRASTSPARGGARRSGRFVHGHSRLLGQWQDHAAADRGRFRAAGRR
jgi:iron(III) transport system permease protein